MATNLSQDLEAVRSKLPDLLKTDMKTSDITSKSRSSRGGKPSTLIGDILQGESESTASELLAPKRTTTSSSSSNSTADRLLGGLEVGSKESAEEVDKAFRFTKEDQKAFEQKSELRSSLVSQDLGYVTRADLEQLRKLKESGNAREYEMLRSRLLEKKQHNEQIEQQNVATWGKIKTNIKTVLKRRSDGLEKLEKQLVELNKLLGSSNTIGDRELKMARAIDDQYMDVMQFSFFNMMTAPERMLASLGPQLVDAFMNAFRIMDRMNDFDWTYLNPLSNFAELLYGKLFNGRPGNANLHGLDLNHTANNGAWFYRGPVHPYSLTTATDIQSDTYVMNGRGLYIMEPNLYDVAPVTNLMPLDEFQHQINSKTTTNPGYSSFVWIRTYLADLVTRVGAAARVAIGLKAGTHDNIPAEAAQAWILTLVPPHVNNPATALQDSINNITGGNVYATMPNSHPSMPVIVPDCSLLECLVNYHANINTIDTQKKNRIMIELTKLNKSMAEMENTVFRTLADTAKNYVKNMMTKRTSLFHVAGIGSILGSNLYQTGETTLAALGLDQFLGVNVRNVQALQYTVAANLHSVMPEVFSLSVNEDRRFMLICIYKRLLLMLKFMIITCSKMYPIMNKHNEFNEDSKLGNLYLTLKKLLWKIVFSDQSQLENIVHFISNRTYLMSCGFRGWIKTELLARTPESTPAFDRWFNFNTNSFISIDMCQEYRSLLDDLIKANPYQPFENFNIVYNDGSSDKRTTPINLLEELVKYIQTDLSTTLAESTADYLSDKVSLTSTTESDSIIF